jgi:hypothetical protein
MSLQSLLLIGAANACVVVKIAGDAAMRIRVTAIAVAATPRPPFPAIMLDIWMK